MRPAFSVIFFTVASGAGYGMLFWIGVAAPFGLLPVHFWLALVSMAVATGLITGGLLSSTAHLGRPERAWRAFSQWRSSWLSREGIASLFTFVPLAIFVVGWILLRQSSGWLAVAGLAMAACSAVTVCMTAMIYASLKPVREWNNGYTLPGFLVFAAMTGAVLVNALFQAFDHATPMLTWLAMFATALGWSVKRLIRNWQETATDGSKLADAVGLGKGEIRSLEWPHTQQNYLLKEMGYRIARKHSARLRMIAQLLAFALPLVLLALSPFAPRALSVAAALLAALMQLIGMLVERWLFFAEARHTVTLYYGYRDTD